MDYEKKYKDSLERARVLNNGEDVDIEAGTTTCEYIFPELKEESEDEKIRKELISLFQDCIDIKNHPYNADDSRRWLAWLEKQGEKQDYNPYKATIESIAAMVEKYANGDLKDFYDNIKVKCKDAVEYDKTWNEKQDEQNSADSYCQENCKGFKETGKCYADGECKAKRDAEQKPTWSEEDEKMMKQIDSLLYCQCTIHSSMYEKLHNWLKSLKDRVQPHWKPTKEQIYALSMAYKDSLTSGENLITQTETLKSLYNDLKKL